MEFDFRHKTIISKYGLFFFIVQMVKTYRGSMFKDTIS